MKIIFKKNVTNYIDNSNNDVVLSESQKLLVELFPFKSNFTKITTPVITKEIEINFPNSKKQVISDLLEIFQNNDFDELTFIK